MRARARVSRSCGVGRAVPLLVRVVKSADDRGMDPLERCRRAALQNAAAVVGGVVARRVRTVERRLWRQAISVTARKKRCNGASLLFSTGVGDERINHKITEVS